ncbi:MAG TPA: TIGR04282 family arsenosugar biosynthesis glycosyltransferase [Beijerinckiaceae bacterium]|jgi:rSAM/selenodomain-associated transferase 1
MADLAILAKAPVPGFAKTRLVPLLGPEGAARLQERLIERALATALASAIGPITLWCAPDEGHPAFQSAGSRPGVRLARQPDGDLGARMLAAFRAASAGSGMVLIGTDCPVLTAADLRAAASALATADLVIAPAEDGGYGLIAASRPHPGLFECMPWSTDQVAALTRHRARQGGLQIVELRTVWDVDTPADVARLRATNPGLDIPAMVKNTAARPA